MKIAVLTTDTTHHAYFVREVTKSFPIDCVFIETNTLAAPFATHHPFESKRDTYERNIWFGGAETRINAFADVQHFPSINDPKAVMAVREHKPDIIIVFGTGKLYEPIISIAPQNIINLHGGDPREYRGLDSHLWAIYHRDFKNLTTCLHRLTADLDDGDIIDTKNLPLKPRTSLHELRQINTVICVQLTTAALQSSVHDNLFGSYPQNKKGRYYSFMPTPLKNICVDNFSRYTDNLD